MVDRARIHQVGDDGQPLGNGERPAQQPLVLGPWATQGAVKSSPQWCRQIPAHLGSEGFSITTQTVSRSDGKQDMILIFGGRTLTTGENSQLRATVEAILEIEGLKVVDADVTFEDVVAKTEVAAMAGDEAVESEG